VTHVAAAAAEPFGNFGRGLALALLVPEARNANADGLDFLVNRVPAITILVSPLLIFRVRGGPVQFHAR
jgi:hypothetical protein